MLSSSRAAVPARGQATGLPCPGASSPLLASPLLSSLLLYCTVLRSLRAPCQQPLLANSRDETRRDEARRGETRQDQTKRAVSRALPILDPTLAEGETSLLRHLVHRRPIARRQAYTCVGLPESPFSIPIHPAFPPCRHAASAPPLEISWQKWEKLSAPAEAVFRH